MQSLEEIEAAGLKLCHACNAEVRNLSDKFCRRCGARQIHDTDRLPNDPSDYSIAPSMDLIAEADHQTPPQNATIHGAFENMRRRLFSLLGTES